jgi:hypothetical protein
MGKYTFWRNDTKSSQRTPTFIEKGALIVGEIGRPYVNKI